MKTMMTRANVRTEITKALKKGMLPSSEVIWNLGAQDSGPIGYVESRLHHGSRRSPVGLFVSHRRYSPKLETLTVAQLVARRPRLLPTISDLGPTQTQTSFWLALSSAHDAVQTCWDSAKFRGLVDAICED